MSTTTISGADAAAGKRQLPFSGKTGVAVGVAVILLAGGIGYILMPKASESTDAAYVQADSSVVAPKVRGLVAAVLVRHNQPVHRGDALVRIDPEEFDSRVAAATADVNDARASILEAKAALQQLVAEEAVAASNITAARTQIASTTAQRARADADKERYDALVDAGAVARREVDQYNAAAISAQSDAERAGALLQVAQNQAKLTTAKRPVLEAAVAKAQAQEERARAALQLAEQDQGHTTIYAPVEGVVGDRQVEPGDYVQPGTRLLTVAPLGALYVIANFKETQVGRMAPGRMATIKVDALPGVRLKGQVESFAPGTGSQFSLLPFEPGTGNFTKIVQRLPVRIRLAPGQPGLERLRPGLSTTVTVRLTK